MSYELSQLVDIAKLQAILDDLSNITELPSAIFDLKGNNLTDSGWQEVCKYFYKSNSTTRSICYENSKYLIKKAIETRKFVIDKCPFGITNITCPINIDGKPIAVIMVGQFFVEEPSFDFFLEHINSYDFDKDEFLKYFERIPTIPMKKASAIAGFVEKFAQMIAQLSINNIKLKESEELMSRELIQVNEYDRLKTEFLANISHDLRTPINIIFCSLQMLNMYMKGYDSPNNEKMSRHIKMMKQNSYRLLRLIDNLIDITKIEGGSFNLNMYNCDIVKIIEKITTSVSEYAESKNLSLQFKTNIRELIIACDPDKIERIILNLLSNSMKFTPTGGSIVVTVMNKSEKLVISVKDTGVGIPKEKSQFVFERFSQLNGGLTRNQEGNGIGLSLVKSLVELHNGNININTEYSEGCEVIIEFPITQLASENKKADNIIVNNTERIIVEFSDIYDYIE